MANEVRRQLQASTPHIFCWVYFTGTPVNISELSGECWGGEGGGRRAVQGNVISRIE